MRFAIFLLVSGLSFFANASKTCDPEKMVQDLALIYGMEFDSYGNSPYRSIQNPYPYGLLKARLAIGEVVKDIQVSQNGPFVVVVLQMAKAGRNNLTPVDFTFSGPGVQDLFQCSN